MTGKNNGHRRADGIAAMPGDHIYLDPGAADAVEFAGDEGRCAHGCVLVTAARVAAVRTARDMGYSLSLKREVKFKGEAEKERVARFFADLSDEGLGG